LATPPPTIPLDGHPGLGIAEAFFRELHDDVWILIRRIIDLLCTHYLHCLDLLLRLPLLNGYEQRVSGSRLGKPTGLTVSLSPHLHSLCEVPTFAASTNVSTFKITRLVSNSPHSKLAPFLVIVGQDPS